MRAIAALGLAFAGAAFAAEPAAWVPPAETRCDLEGWTTDTDPAGLNVRAAPSARAAVVGTLPAYDAGEGHLRTSRFSIRGSAGGWLRIERGAEYRVQDVPDEWPDRPAYAGSGWISGRHAGFAVQSARGYAKPDAASTEIVDLKSDWLTDLGAVDRIVACSGRWALVDFHLEHRRDGDRLLDLTPREKSASPGRAWFRGICPIIETTCDDADPAADGRTTPRAAAGSPQAEPRENGDG